MLDDLKEILYNDGSAATIVYKTGTVCPCKTSRAGQTGYNPEWHRNNPTAENCNNTTLIKTTTVTLSVKTVILNLAIPGRMMDQEKQKDWAKETIDKWCMIDAINTSTLAIVDLSTALDPTVTWEGKSFRIGAKIPIDLAGNSFYAYMLEVI